MMNVNTKKEKAENKLPIYISKYLIKIIVSYTIKILNLSVRGFLLLMTY